MAVNESEKCVEVKKFSELSKEQQIEKLQYELQAVQRTICRIGNKVALLEEHHHSSNGETLVPINRSNRLFQVDRSGFLE